MDENLDAVAESVEEDATESVDAEATAAVEADDYNDLVLAALSDIADRIERIERHLHL